MAQEFSPTARASNSRRRLIKDALAQHAVGVGGVGVIIAILLIFAYLLYVVIPLFEPAQAKQVASYAQPGSGSTLHLALEEQAEQGVRYTSEGHAVFFRLADGKVIDDRTLPLPQGVAVTSLAAGDPAGGLVALGLADGRVLVVRHTFAASFEGDKRHLTPALEYPLGEAPIVVDRKGQALSQIAVQATTDESTLVAATADRRLLMVHVGKKTSFLDESETLTLEQSVLPAAQESVTHILLDPEQKHLYVTDSGGELSCFDISDKAAPVVLQRLRVVDEGVQLTSLRFLAGGISLLVGDSQGRVVQWFPVRDKQNNQVLTRIRDFQGQRAPITDVAPEYHRKGLLAADDAGHVGIYHTTAHRTLLMTSVSQNGIRHLAVAPRADAMLAEDKNNEFHFWHIRNEHPEVSWSSLWSKVWYESYPKPDFVWQSSSSANDFEPKFSLVPLAFGTLKAAFYAILVAAPLAILGAIYTAYFMAPRLRRVVKPSIEVMEALPTVILGFLAGLWLAPLVEENLPGIFSMLLVMPIGILLFAYVWFRLPGRVRHAVPDGWEPLLLVPVVLLVGGMAIGLSPTVEAAFFGGDIRSWLTNKMGIAFDQRNALVVGLAMGFAVIPNIYSIAEDALFGVPKHLSHGSLALGATPWQTLWRVVLLTASPGIFSALMIGMGRAVGETMIVLMATGNTPVMDFSMFQGMRTLSANIAVEMPESEVNGTHYRVLFLAALLLFMFTFFFNTLAEIIRQRLRRKYSTL